MCSSDKHSNNHLMVCTTKPTFSMVLMVLDALLVEKKMGLSGLLVTKLLEEMEMGLPSPLVTNSRIIRELLIAPSSNDI